MWTQQISHHWKESDFIHLGQNNAVNNNKSWEKENGDLRIFCNFSIEYIFNNNNNWTKPYTFDLKHKKLIYQLIAIPYFIADD